jgi:hypothetical protein
MLVDDTPEHINYMYGFILWICLPLIGLIPALVVEEDLRRLNMKDVQKSDYVEEQVLMLKTEAERSSTSKTTNLLRTKKLLSSSI